jgi:DsbC/DsbD-like thiol-disulfide interchange protein
MAMSICPSRKGDFFCFMVVLRGGERSPISQGRTGSRPNTNVIGRLHSWRYAPPMNSYPMTRRTLVSGALGASLLTRAAAALDDRYRFRLIAGAAESAKLRAGIEIGLAPGWKTYWRMPGDAGVPPQFEWTGSENIGSIDVLWPAPHRFTEQDGDTVGYKEHVIFPVHFLPERADDPVRLRLQAFFGVCSDVCIPVTEQSDLADWRKDPIADALISSFERRVPSPAQPSSALFVVTARADAEAAALMLTFGSPAPAQLDIFVEAPGGAYFKAPHFIGERTCMLSVTGLKDPAHLRGMRLKLTIVGENLALEQDVLVT